MWDIKGSLLSLLDEAVLSRMITTVDDDTNGFRNTLLPMILTDTTHIAGKALLHAVLALSAFYLGHLGQALDQKVKAIKNLSQSCKASDADSSSRMIQLAACMLLCVYEVYHPYFPKSHRRQNANILAHRFLMPRKETGEYT